MVMASPELFLPITLLTGMVMRPVEGSYLPLRSYPMAMPFQQNAVARCLNHDAAGTLAVVDEAAVGGYVVFAYY